MELVQDVKKSVYGPKIVRTEKDSIQPPVFKQGSVYGEVISRPIQSYADNTDNLTAVDEFPDAKTDDDKLHAIDEEIQKITEGSKDAWKKFKESVDPSETPEERLARDPEFKPWEVQKTERAQKISKLQELRRNIKDKLQPTTPEMEEEVISSFDFKQDPGGRMLNNYKGIVDKIGLNKYNRIDRETYDRAYDTINKYNIQNFEKAGNTIGLYSFPALDADKPKIDESEVTGLKKLLDESQKDPEFSGTGKLSGLYNYESKRTRMDKLVKSYVDSKFEDPEIRKKKYIDYAKTMNSIMTVDMNDGSMSMYGLKSYTESVIEQAKSRYDEISNIYDKIHNAEYEEGPTNTIRLQKLLGSGPDFKQNYENFTEYKDRIESEYRSLKGTIEFAEKILKTPEQKRGLRDLAKGLGRDNLLSDIVTLGIDEMVRTLKVGEIAKKVSAGDYEPTWSEQKILEMYSVLQETQSKNTVGDISTIAHGTTNMIPYILTFAGTRFAFTGAKQFFKAGISGVSDVVLGSLKPSIIKGMTVKTGPFIGKVLGKAEIDFTKYIADYSAKAAAAGVQTAVLPQYYMKNIAERSMPNISTELNEDFSDAVTKIDANTKYTKTGAVTRGILDSYFEILTEYGGRQFMKMAKLPVRGVKALMGKDVSKAIVLDNFFKIKGYKSFREGLNNVVEKGLGWHGIREE